MIIDIFSPILEIGLVSLLGFIVGSFLNVVIYRIPVMMDREEKQYAWEVIHGEGEIHPDVPTERFNLLFPASRCPNCGHKIRAWENIPVISYLIQGRKCTGCGTLIPSRYMLVEILTAILSGVITWHFSDPLQLAFALIFTWGLIVLFFIDTDHQLLPDRITLPLLWLGIIAGLISYDGSETTGLFISLNDSVLGAIVGYLTLWTIYWIFKLWTGREGMGYGDFKLLACLLAWQGVAMLPMILLVSSICGIIFFFITKVGRGNPMPFGPYLATSGWITFLFGSDMAAYLQFFPA